MLQRGRLVTQRRAGRNRFYALDPQPLSQIDAWLAPYRLFWAARLHELKAAIESNPTPNPPRPAAKHDGDRS